MIYVKKKPLWRDDGYDQRRIDAALTKRTLKGVKRLSNFVAGGWKP